MKFYSATLLVIALSACGGQNNKEKIFSPCELKLPYEYSKVLRMQDSCLKDFTWPYKHELDLNNDSVNEQFLAVEGYARGMNYAVFSAKDKTWNLISGDEPVASGHLGVEKLKTKNKGWHNFIAYQPAGRDGKILESYYSWDGKKYFLKAQKEITPNR